MATKGRSNVFFSHGMCAGWTDYRYGRPAAPVTLAGPKTRKILKGRKRDAVISEAMDRLRDWRMSAFEQEGPVRTALRSGLCLAGRGWQRSDDEAAAIVGEGLARLGAERPSWREGQPEYGNTERDEKAREAMVERTRPCRRCGTLFAPRLVSHDTLYCSWECVPLPERHCLACGKGFAPRHKGSKYCSHACSAKGQRTVAERQCRHCLAVFRPKNGNQAGEGHYCSMACRDAARATMRIEKTCECCGAAFVAKHAKAKFCRPACRERVSALRSGKWKPETFSPVVFDCMIRMAA